MSQVRTNATVYRLIPNVCTSPFSYELKGVEGELTAKTFTTKFPPTEVTQFRSRSHASQCSFSPEDAIARVEREIRTEERSLRRLRLALENLKTELLGRGEIDAEKLQAFIWEHDKEEET